MMRRSAGPLGVLALAGSLGCLPVFGPDLRPRGHHAGLESGTPRDGCMGCHVDEHQAIASGVDEDHPAPAPIVADWMLEDPRECVTCHRLRAAHQRRSAWQLAPLGPGVAHAR
jgi:hypothetical protein